MSFNIKAGARLSITLLLAACLVSACASVNRAGQSPEELMETLEPGDVVSITTTTGERYEFVLESIDEEGLSGSGVTVSYEQIDKIEATRETSTGDVVKVLGASAAVAAIFYYLFVAPWQNFTIF